MMTGSHPEYSTSRVAGFFLAMMIQRGSSATKKAHTKGFTYALLSEEREAAGQGHIPGQVSMNV